MQLKCAVKEFNRTLGIPGGSEEKDALTPSNKKDRIVANMESDTFMKSVGKQVFSLLLTEWQTLRPLPVKKQ